jgi:hypothetical protein
MKDFFLPTISPSNKVIFDNNYSSSKPKISQLYKLAHYNYLYEKDYNQALLKSYITNDSKSINKKKIEPSNYYAPPNQTENTTNSTNNINSYKIVYKRKKQNKINLKRNVVNDYFSTPRYINTQSSQSSKYSFPNISTQESEIKITEIKKKPSGLKDLEIKFKYITSNRKYDPVQNINLKEN